MGIWRAQEIKLEHKLFKNWQTDTCLAPLDGSLFMGRIMGSDRAIAVRWCPSIQSFTDVKDNPVKICQWISFADFAGIRACVWRGP